MKQYNALEKLLGSRFEEVRGKIITEALNPETLSPYQKRKLRNEISEWVSIFGSITRVSFELHVESKVLYDFLR